MRKWADIFLFIGVLLVGCGFFYLINIKDPPLKYNREEGAHMYTNKLVDQKSPYLLRHAHNPVNWYPWGQEAFDKAKEEDKPIFLSIGYSTCRWCHVMEQESFSNIDIARMLNENFVCIKVDREERPDIDNIYMSAVTAMTGSGGWPLNVFLTHDLKPFYGGTYFPPEDKKGFSGLKTVIPTIAYAWDNQRKEILRSSELLVKAIEKQTKYSAAGHGDLDETLLHKAYAGFAENFDADFAGFGQAQKFPTAHALSFLLRYWKRTGRPEALYMVEKTLTAISKGGIYDHIGKGVHRYAADRQWKVPHFEKMLYDQAILSKAYLEAYQVTGNNEYAFMARDILDYVLRDLRHKEGAFFSAQDADSLSSNSEGQKTEGAFYVWSRQEIVDALGAEYAEVFNYCFGIDPTGNVDNDPSGEFKGKNILYRAHSAQEASVFFKKSPENITEIIEASKIKLNKYRQKRPKPYLDDKILVDWNGLMISSLAVASRVLNEPRYSKAARQAAEFITLNLKNKEERLLHRYINNEAAIPAMIEDYAFFIQGLCDLYESTFNIEYLAQARELTDEMVRLFWDQKEAGFFFTGSDAEELIVRTKEIYDGAIPSGNSVAALCLVKIGTLTKRDDLIEKSNQLIKAFYEKIDALPQNYAQMLIGLDFILGPLKEIVIIAKTSDINGPIARAAFKFFIPNKLVIFSTAEDKGSEKILSILPSLEDYALIDNKTTAYLCSNNICIAPALSGEGLEELLK